VLQGGTHFESSIHTGQCRASTHTLNCFNWTALVNFKAKPANTKCKRALCVLLLIVFVGNAILGGEKGLIKGFLS